jgi:hypothetical protein
MSRIRRGNYVFVTWSGDHDPRHVHVYRGSRLVLNALQTFEIFAPLADAA